MVPREEGLDRVRVALVALGPDAYEQAAALGREHPVRGIDGNGSPGLGARRRHRLGERDLMLEDGRLLEVDLADEVLDQTGLRAEVEEVRRAIGSAAVVQLTGLRTPCGYIDRFRKGLKRTMMVRTPEAPRFRAGVLGIVSASGDVAVGDKVRIEYPERPWLALPAI